MADETNTVSDLSDLKDIAGDAPAADAAEIAQNPAAPLREQELDAQGRAYATGRRKDATARVWLKPGTGKITVNGKDQETYFARPTLRLIINQPFGITEREGQYDIIATVKGGGLSGQAGAVKHGISQALTKYEPELRSTVNAAASSSRSVKRSAELRFSKRRSRSGPPFLFARLTLQKQQGPGETGTREEQRPRPVDLKVPDRHRMNGELTCARPLRSDHQRNAACKHHSKENCFQKIHRLVSQIARSLGFEILRSSKHPRCAN